MPSNLLLPACAAVVVPMRPATSARSAGRRFPQSVIATVRRTDGLTSTTRRGSRRSQRPRPAERRLGVTRGTRARRRTGWLSSSGAIDHGRFAPGTLLGGRYRIIERLGRGGMGEVYRADDLKLGQPVALKFLPADVDRDPARLTQLHTEVRMARQVSHPNVCRVYDIDEIDGSTFLSMEYVDGEDLASLLRRIGRFPEERALEIARQICAGLAAAHERGVVHRDLKPANVMLDGAGKVRITDFGLAGVVGRSAPRRHARLHGAGAARRRRGHGPQRHLLARPRALRDLHRPARARRQEPRGADSQARAVRASRRRPRSSRRSIRRSKLAIMRCLKPQPEERPASALAVAAALPGGDPLAAALAAGETPSPEMVAAAGQTDARAPGDRRWLVVAFVVAALLVCAAAGDRYLLYARVPMQKSLDSLQDRARDIMVSLGYPLDGHRLGARTVDQLRRRQPHLAHEHRRQNRWDALNRRTSPVMLFWYRSSPEPLVPLSTSWTPTWHDPPMTIAGMTTHGAGRHGQAPDVRSRAAARRGSDAAPASPAPWPALFTAAGLDINTFHRGAAAAGVPRPYATERRAWEGPHAAASTERCCTSKRPLIAACRSPSA